MADNKLSVRRVEGVVDGTVAATLSQLLRLTSDAVIVFNMEGTVLLANEEAESLFAKEDGTIAGLDVRFLFTPANQENLQKPFSVESLPFAIDGSTSMVAAPAQDGTSQVLSVRADYVGAPTQAIVLTASKLRDLASPMHDDERMVLDLRRANKRLSGALQIVLDTLDSEDMGQLIERVLEELSETVEADGALIYLAEQDGYHLHGATESLKSASYGVIPRYFAFNSSLERLTFYSEHALRLHTMPLNSSTLKQGRVKKRNLVNEETREVITVDASHLPPFTSFLVVPVWFGGHIVALIEVGWERKRALLVEDARLLDSIANYLSVQLVGALSAMRTQRRDTLREALARVRQGLLHSAAEGEKISGERLQQVMRSVGTDLNAQVFSVDCCEVTGNITLHALGAEQAFGDAQDGAQVAAEAGGAQDGGNQIALPSTVEGLKTGEGEASVKEVELESELSRALAAQGLPCKGAVLFLGKFAGEQHTWLFLREENVEPLSDIELDFLDRVMLLVHSLAVGAEESQQNKHISQALQSGMKNDLQKVEGISAEGIYSSATADAFVGGDFYSMIKLPGRRACIIMGDVSGKGIEAASISSAVKTALSAYAWEGRTPARMVATLNEFLLGFSRVETFATLFVGIVDLVTSSLTYCSAGHPPAILVSAQSGEAELMDVQSGVVGAFHDMEYKNGTVRLHEGDILLLYTDGTTEARSPEGAFFGETGLRDMIMNEVPRGFDGLLNRFLSTLDRYTGRRLDDDVAMVALRFDELGSGDSGVLGSANSGEKSN
ncbi:SpoIIE family protein phosphatase [Lancefieldella parvula]|uniref:SpoIIE family protein phosphatase n=1 Tax=Lancefieldella parvula TaxID=1382 RepID=UPI0028D70DBF|nr:SpoIIE family protein phosphatase [Lancefieldella parvula]